MNDMKTARKVAGSSRPFTVATAMTIGIYLIFIGWRILGGT